MPFTLEQRMARGRGAHRGPGAGGRLLATVCCLIMLAGAWASGARADAPCRLPIPYSETEAREILSTQRPFAPGDRDRFYSFDDPDWVDAAPLVEIEGPAPSEDETRGALRDFLARRFTCAPDRVRDGLAVYGDPVARQKLPEPTLRAALAALVGTVGEPAIEFLLYRSPVTLVHFGIYVDADTGLPGHVAGAFVAPDETRFIVIDRRYRFDPFPAFSGLLVHEALHAGHDNDTAGLPEESTASAVEALVYMQMLLVDPELAGLPDEFTRISNNRLALVRLNSAPAGSDRLTLFVPGGDVNIDPLASAPLTEFYEYYARTSAPEGDTGFRDRETTGNWLLAQILAGLAEPSVTPPADPSFDQATLAFIDQNQAALSPAEQVAVACILKLDVPCG